MYWSLLDNKIHVCYSIWIDRQPKTVDCQLIGFHYDFYSNQQRIFTNQHVKSSACIYNVENHRDHFKWLDTYYFSRYFSYVFFSSNRGYFANSTSSHHGIFHFFYRKSTFLVWFFSFVHMFTSCLSRLFIFHRVYSSIFLLFSYIIRVYFFCYWNIKYHTTFSTMKTAITI